MDSMKSYLILVWNQRNFNPGLYSLLPFIAHNVHKENFSANLWLNVIIWKDWKNISIINFFLESFSCKGTKFLYILSPPTHTYIFVLQNQFISWFPFPQPISIEAIYLSWFDWRSQKWLTFTFNIIYSKGFPVFNHNLCANGANYDVFIELDLLPWLRITEIQILMKSCLARLRPKSINISYYLYFNLIEHNYPKLNFGTKHIYIYIYIVFYFIIIIEIRHQRLLQSLGFSFLNRKRELFLQK